MWSVSAARLAGCVLGLLAVSVGCGLFRASEACGEDYPKAKRSNISTLKAGQEFVFVCQDAGAGGYEAFPDVCRLTDG